MYAIALSLLFMASIGWISVLTDNNASDQSALRSQALAANFMVYRNAVDDYLRAYPTFSGTVADSSLSFPSWYQKSAAWTNVIAAKQATVFLTAGAKLPVASIAYDLSTLSGGSKQVGVNQGGALFAPGYGNTGIALSAAVPNGSPAAFYQVN